MPFTATMIAECFCADHHITALKQLYERHSNDLAKLKKTYELHAKDCTQAAELTVDPGRRDVYLSLAREWTEAAEALLAQTQ